MAAPFPNKCSTLVWRTGGRKQRKLNTSGALLSRTASQLTSLITFAEIGKSENRLVWDACKQSLQKMRRFSPLIYQQNNLFFQILEYAYNFVSLRINYLEFHRQPF
jgi:hypothetical protein